MSESKQSQKVSVIGLGNMGSALAEALLTSGHRVTVWNRTAANCAALAEAGAEVVASAVDATRRADVLVLCIIDYDASMSIFASDGMDEALEGKTLIQLTTMSAAKSQTLDAWTRERDA